MQISQAAFDLIVREEVSSQAYYVRHYQHPEWPGGASGITIGIGYDLGYATPNKIRADWGPHVTTTMLLVMIRCSGVHGDDARAILSEVQSEILIPWDQAIYVFSERDIPQWTAAVIKACPGADKMTPTCLGVLVSLAYNRGAAGFNAEGDRYSEMRAIRSDIPGRIPAIPTELRSMERLWPNVSDLRNRREHEATLFQEGLTVPGVLAKVSPTPDATDPEIPLNDGPARTKPSTTTTAQHTTAGVIVAGGVIAAHQAGFQTGIIIVTGIVSAVIAGVVWWLWYRSRNPT
jgi:hypothetical protein